MKRGTTLTLVIVGAVAAFILIGLFVAVTVVRAGSGLDAMPSWTKGLGYVEVEGTIIDARETVEDLQTLEKNSLVKGILLYIDSPGGLVTPSHEIYSEISRISEEGTPVVAVMGTIAASGGYYIAAPADLIVASPQTLTGSIGVIMEFPVVKGVMDKVGVKVEVVKSREHKDIGSPFRDMTDRDRDLLQGVVTDAYDQFVSVVSTGRDIPEDSVRAFADGRILTGRQARALGLVDSLGTFEDAKRIAAEVCGIDGEPRLIRPPRRIRSLLRKFIEGTTEELFGGARFPRLRYIYY